jgi:hypothetical protein
MLLEFGFILFFPPLSFAKGASTMQNPRVGIGSMQDTALTPTKLIEGVLNICHPWAVSPTQFLVFTGLGSEKIELG